MWTLKLSCEIEVCIAFSKWKVGFYDGITELLLISSGVSIFAMWSMHCNVFLLLFLLILVNDGLFHFIYYLYLIIYITNISVDI